MEIEFTGEIFYWRGPSPFYFVTIPEKESADIKAISTMVTYGWGVIPVHVTVGDTTFKTSLFPKEDRYLVPVKADVRKAELLETGDTVAMRLEVKM